MSYLNRVRTSPFTRRFLEWSWTRPVVATTLVIALVSSLVGCGHRARDRVVTVNDIAADRTKITNFMSAPIRPGSPSERTPASVPRSAIMDEARITRFSPNGVCVAVRMRTDVDVDVPLTEYDVEINGVRASVDREEVSYAEYDYTGERTKVAADFVSNHAAGSFRMTEREARKFRVVERRGEVCGAPPRDGKVVLQLVIPQDDHRGNWGEKFIWTVERKALTSGEVVATPSSTPSEPEPKAAPSPSPSPAVLPTAPPSDPSSVPGTYSL